MLALSELQSPSALIETGSVLELGNRGPERDIGGHEEQCGSLWTEQAISLR